MTTEAIQIINHIENLVLLHFVELQDEFMSRYERKLVYIDFIKKAGKPLKSYDVIISFINDYSFKKIEFYFKIIQNTTSNHTGLNVDCWVRNLVENNCDLRKSFRIQDYCTYLDIELPEKFVFGLSLQDLIDDPIIETYLIDYFAFLKSIIERQDMQTILNTDYWVDIPIDWSPYK